MNSVPRSWAVGTDLGGARPTPNRSQQPLPRLDFVLAPDWPAQGPASDFPPSSYNQGHLNPLLGWASAHAHADPATESALGRGGTMPPSPTPSDGLLARLRTLTNTPDAAWERLGRNTGMMPGAQEVSYKAGSCDQAFDRCKAIVPMAMSPRCYDAWKTCNSISIPIIFPGGVWVPSR